MASKLVLTVLLFLLPLKLIAQENASERYIFLLNAVPYSFTYPADWVTSEALGQVILSSSEEAHNRILSGAELGPNDVYMFIAASEILFFLWDVFEPITEMEDMTSLVTSAMSSEWVLGEAQDRELSDGSHVATATGEARSGEQVAAFVIVEYDAGRFLLFFAAASEGEPASLVTLLMHTAASLEIGSEVSLETATVTEVKTVELEESIFPIEITNDRIYAIERCGQCPGSLVTLSLDGEELAHFDFESLPRIMGVEPTKNGSLWVSHPAISGDFTYDVSLLSSDGDVVLTLDLKETSLAPIMETDIEGNLYLVVTYAIEPEVTQPPSEVRRDSTETWIQVWDRNGELLREFPIMYDEYTLNAGVNAIALNADNNLYIIDADTNRGIMTFDTQGNALREGFGQGKVMFQSITGFDVMPDGTFFIGISVGSLEKLTNLILHLSSDGELQGVFTADSLGMEALYLSTQFSMDENGDVVVSGTNYEVVQVFQMTVTPPLAP
jgi:hypothetical protein